MNVPVITGVGAVSAFGVGFPLLREGLRAGACAVGGIRSMDVIHFPLKIAGEVPVVHTDDAWVASSKLPPVWRSRAWDGALRDRKVAFALLAAAEAWRHAGGSAELAHACVVMGVGLECAFLEDALPLYDGTHVHWEREPAADIPVIRFRTPPDAPARMVREALGLTGRHLVHVDACAAGALAVAHAASLIQRGAARVVLCGGTDSMVNPFGLGGMWRLGAPSPRNAADACRPFDLQRDGLVVGEGSAMFVVEELSHARARGAPFLAHVAGWASTQDGYRVTAPRPDGSAALRAMQEALERAHVTREDLGYINAHGTGTRLNDEAEATAIAALLGRSVDNVPVSSIKGAIGHLMAAAGAMELAACLVPFLDGVLPGTTNLKTVDPACPIHVLGPQPVRADVDAVLSNSFGFGGQNASVVLRRAP